MSKLVVGHSVAARLLFVLLWQIAVVICTPIVHTTTVLIEIIQDPKIYHHREIIIRIVINTPRTACIYNYT